MACGSGCCGSGPLDRGPPEKANAPVTGVTGQPSDSSSRAIGAGQEEAAVTTESQGSVSERVSSDCSKGFCDADPVDLSSSSPAIANSEACCSFEPEITDEKVKTDSCCQPAVKKPDDCCAPDTSAPAKPSDGCCSGSEKPIVESPVDACQSASNTTSCCSGNAQVPGLDKKGGCRGSSEKPTVDAAAGTCQSPPDATSCCSGDAKAPEPAKKGCCSPVKDVVSEQGCCQTASYDAPPKKTAVVSEEVVVPDCCAGKTSPCCDDACLDRIALRDCDATCQLIDQQSKGGSSGKQPKPCSAHSRKAHSRYQAKLEALGCICRALVARGLESCCPAVQRPSRPSSRKSATRSTGSSVRSSRGSLNVKAMPAGKSCCSKGGTCEKPKPPTCAAKESKGCCDTVEAYASSESSGCADACCGNTPLVVLPPTVKTQDRSGRADVDIEKSGTGTPKEHVVISISGMTCTGCETKLQRTLGVLKPVINLKTSLVLSRVEFDLDPGDLSAEDVIKHLERTTEFKCDKINVHSSGLDLMCDDPSTIVNGQWPKGVTGIKLVEKGRMIRIEFDSALVGARDLVEKGWHQPMQLAPPRLDPSLEAGGKHVKHMGLMTLFSIAMTIPVLVLAWAPLPERELAYSSASLALATIVQVVVAGPFYPKALKSLVFSRIIEMDLLIVLSTSAAYIFSVVSFGYLVSGKPLSTGEFFETSTLLVTLIMVGRYVAALARQKAVESISIRSLQTMKATILSGSGEEKEVDTRLLQFGDTFKVAPESKIPTDGTVISGHSEADESMLTGESLPIEKQPGSIVVAGSINGSGVLVVRLTRLPENNTISTIATMVDEAKLSKPKIQEMADRIASYFVPVIIGLTIITFVAWIAVGVAVRGQSGQKATINAVTYAITVLIVSCPCAIGLAVPMVIVISTGMAAERGIVFKSSQSIEVAYKAKHVIFDKTGTVTTGKLTVSHEEYMGGSQHIRSMLLGLIGDNKHPVSVAVAEHLKGDDVQPASVTDTKVVTAKGVEGKYEGHVLRAGHSRWLDMVHHKSVQQHLASGKTAFCFTVDGEPAAAISLYDEVRPDAVSTVTKLQSLGITVHVLSGDDDGAVRKATQALGVADENTRSRCSPAEKHAYIQQLRPGATEDEKQPVVIFCGDGTNDAVALAGATIGIHMNGGTDIAQSAADVVLVRPDLAKILTVLKLSRKSMHRVAFNFGWSFVYNLLAILLASGALVNVRIPPQFAGLGELVSVVPVVAAAALLRWSKV